MVSIVTHRGLTSNKGAGMWATFKSPTFTHLCVGSWGRMSRAERTWPRAYRTLSHTRPQRRTRASAIHTFWLSTSPHFAFPLLFSLREGCLNCPSSWTLNYELIYGLHVEHYNVKMRPSGKTFPLPDQGPSWHLGGSNRTKNVLTGNTRETRDGPPGLLQCTADSAIYLAWLSCRYDSRDILYVSATSQVLGKTASLNQSGKRCLDWSQISLCLLVTHL